MEDKDVEEFKNNLDQLKQKGIRPMDILPICIGMGLILMLPIFAIGLTISKLFKLSCN